MPAAGPVIRKSAPPGPSAPHHHQATLDVTSILLPTPLKRLHLLSATSTEPLNCLPAFHFLPDPEAHVQLAAFCSAQDQPFVVLSSEPGKLQSRPEGQGGPCSGKSPLPCRLACAYPRREKEEVGGPGAVSSYARARPPPGVGELFPGPEST